MSVKTGCPHCGAELKLKSEKSIGRKVPCPKCRTPFVVKALDESAVDEEWDDYENDYTDQEYEDAYDDDRSGSSRSSPRSGSGRTSNSRRATSGHSKSGAKKRKTAKTGPNWPLIAGGGIAGVVTLIVALVAFWPTGNTASTSPEAASDNAATSDLTPNSTSIGEATPPVVPVALGEFVEFPDENLRLQLPEGFSFDYSSGGFKGFRCQGTLASVGVTHKPGPVNLLADEYSIAKLKARGADWKVFSRTITSINGRTDLLMSFEHPESQGQVFNWCRIFGDESQVTVLTASMPVDEKAKYSEPFKTLLQNVQVRDSQAMAQEDQTVTQSSVEPLLETEVDGIKLVPNKFLGGRIEMLIPASFTPMSDEMARLKYPSGNRPSEILTDESGGVNLAFTYSPQAITPDQLGQMHDSMDRLLRSMNKQADWHASEVTTMNGRPWMKLDFTSAALDTRVHNMIYGTPSGGRLVLVAFNVTVEREEQWLEAAKVMMSSMHAID